MKKLLPAIMLALIFHSLSAEELKEGNEQDLSVTEDQTTETIKSNTELFVQGSLALKPYETFEKKNVSVNGASKSSGNKSSNSYYFGKLISRTHAALA